MRFYEEGPPAGEGSPLQQGDVLINVPFLSISAVTLTVLDGQGTPRVHNAVQGLALGPGARALVAVESGAGIVLNQSCDVTGDAGRGKPLVLARVRPLSEHTDQQLKAFVGKDARPRVKLVKALANAGQNPNVFYLPRNDAAGGFPGAPSFVDLLNCVTLTPSDARALRGARRARLGADALRAFQERLAYLFGRYGADDDLYFSVDEAVAAKEQAAEQAEQRLAVEQQAAAKAARAAAMQGKPAE